MTPLLPPGLVWLASFPKSGNTWMRILLANLVDDNGQAQNINALAIRNGIANSRALFDFHTLLDSSLLRPHEIDLLRPTVHDLVAEQPIANHVVKCHDCWRELDDGRPVLGYGARAAIYVVRDPRDVAVSLAHHMGGTPDDAIAVMSGADDPVQADRQLPYRQGSWSRHVTSWLDQTRVPLLCLRYEDLLHDTVGCLVRTLHFLGAPCPPERIERAVHHASFAELRRQEEAQGFRERRPGQPFFFRRGQAGDWRTSLSPEQVRAIETAHGATMRRLGYPLSTEPLAHRSPA